MGGHKEVAEAALSDPDAAFSGEVVKIDRPSPFEGGGALSGTSGGASGGTMVGLAASVSLVARLVRAGQTQGGCRCAAVGRAHPVAAVGAFLMGCAVLLALVGCAGVRSEAPEEQERGHAEATASERARCGEKRTTVRQGFHRRREDFLTNDLPGCPEGGPLSGTEGSDNLDGKEGDDEVRGLGERDFLFGGPDNDVMYGGPGDDWWFFGGAGNDVIHGGPGDDSLLTGGDGDDVIYGGDGHEGEMFGDGGADVLYGGDGNDWVFTKGQDRQPDELYCGKGEDTYDADDNDLVSRSCEKKMKWGRGIP